MAMADLQRPDSRTIVNPVLRLEYYTEAYADGRQAGLLPRLHDNSDSSVSLTLPVSPPLIKKIKLHVNKLPSPFKFILDEAEVFKMKPKIMSVAHVSAIYPVGLLDLDLVRNHFFNTPVIYNNLKNYVIGIAKNDDGIDQIHCYLHYSAKKNLKTHNSFIIDGYSAEITAVHSKDATIRKIFSLDKFHSNFDSILLKKFSLSPAQRIFISQSQSEAMDIVYSDKSLSNHLFHNPRKLINQIHCYLHYSAKKNLKTHNSFIIDGYSAEITAVHSKDATIRKIFSLDKFHSNFDSILLKKFSLSPAQRIFISQSQSEAMDIVYSDKSLSNHLFHNPRKLISNIKYHTTKVNYHGDPVHRFKDIPQIHQWDRKEHCLLLYGDTTNGKTSYALTLFKKPLVVSSYRKLLDLRDEHDGIVFDDMSFNNLSREESIYITDLKLPRPVKIKELKTEVIIPAGMPRIFTRNKKIFNYHPAIQRRFIFINCNYDLRLYPDGIPPPPHPLMPKISDFN
ncbi:hypothetical protein AYI69_g1599 [Smittium culicis]|uniref:Replication-associated protein n=1 Tax=Smittium culicis TaxID=133412 RepID=A0A1R1YPY5_9FUNG|nr:hypothetical protein AYI69_g1599 [Smittium culicis]